MVAWDSRPRRVAVNPRKELHCEGPVPENGASTMDRRQANGGQVQADGQLPGMLANGRAEGNKRFSQAQTPTQSHSTRK